MRLLLDEHYRPEIAEQLRRRGHDVRAAVETSILLGKEDLTIFEVARAERRALVTENVKDFARLHRYALLDEGGHFGVIFTSPARFSRARRRTGALVIALDALLRRYPGEEELVNRAVWLEPA